MEFPDELVLKQDLVWKRGNTKRLATWKRRFLVLRPSSLSYHQNGLNAAGYIELCQSTEIVRQPSKHAFALEVNTKPFPPLTIRMDTEEEFEAWRIAIESAVRHAPCWPSIRLALVGDFRGMYARFVANLQFPPKRREKSSTEEIVMEMGREWVRLVVMQIGAEEMTHKRAFLSRCDVVLVVTTAQDVNTVDLQFAKHTSAPYLVVYFGAQRGTFQANADKVKQQLSHCHGYCQIEDVNNSAIEIERVFLDCVGLVVVEEQRQLPLPVKSASSAKSLLPWLRKAASNSSSSVKLVHNNDDEEEEEEEQSLPIRRAAPATAEEEVDTEFGTDDDEDDDDDDAGSMVSVEVDETEQQHANQDFGLSSMQEDAQYSVKIQLKKERSIYRMQQQQRSQDLLPDIEETEVEVQKPIISAAEQSRKTVVGFLHRHNKLVEEQLLTMRQQRETQQRVLHEAKPLPTLSYLEELKQQKHKLPAAVVVVEEGGEKSAHGGNSYLAFLNKQRPNAVFFY